MSVFFISILFALVTHSQCASFDFLVSWQYKSPDCVERPTAVINGEFPGPILRVKPGDEVVVKVTNGLASDSLTIHWHGQRQFKNVWHDGIGMISNCPIGPKQSFTYIFSANKEPGTYFYHAHLGGMRSAGIYGVLIIEWPAAPWIYQEEYTLLLNDWYHAPTDELTAGLLEQEFRWSGDPQSILFNGKGFYNCTSHSVPMDKNFPYYKPAATVYCAESQCPGLETLEVKKGNTFLLRLVCASELSFMNIAIEGHNMTLVEVDGQPMEEITVTSLDINSGQRYSVLVTADQSVDAYWINVKTRHRSGVVQGQAILKYTGSGSATPASTVESVDKEQPAWDNITFTFDQQSSLRGKIQAPINDKVTRRIVLLGTQERFDWEGGVAKHPETTPPEDKCDSNGRHLRWAVNRVSYKFENTPVAHMVYYNIRPETLTEERGYFKIQSGDVIDLVIQNYPACNRVCEQHPWHLHGHKFWVVGMGKGTWTGNQEQLDSLNTFIPVKRDTTTVIPDSINPFGNQQQQGGCGWTVVRFVADNPGVWPFHCHVTWHFIMGMQVIFIETPDEFPEPAGDIPICGDVTPELYFSHRKMKEEKKDWKQVVMIIGWVLFGICLFAFIFLLVLYCKKCDKSGYQMDKEDFIMSDVHT